MRTTNKIKNAVNKTAREIPIIAWAVEIDGKIRPDQLFKTRSDARWVRNASVMRYENDTKLSVRKVKLQVIPGR